MKKKLIEHILSILFVSGVLLTFLVIIQKDKNDLQKRGQDEIESYLSLRFIDFDNPFHKALLKETLNIYYPDQKSSHDSLLTAIDQYRAEQFSDDLQKANLHKGLSRGKFNQLLFMYLKFILIYAVVMLFTYYGVQTMAVYRFVRKKQKRTSYIYELFHSLKNKPAFNRWRDRLYFYLHAAATVFKALIKGLLYFILFSPAYVIAYSLKTEFNTDTIFFMIALAVISNGLLITYTHKFYTFLTAESRKGYVQTAIVKNLNASFSHYEKGGISYTAMFQFKKNFKDHIFQHIFTNARYQYLSTIKEQASFLITGLIIIEMALNIQGHLSYELLQQILYKNFDIVIVIILGIFYAVKLTEILTDIIMNRESRKYDNK
jgi:hypothetical protein